MSRVNRGRLWVDEGPRAPQTWDRVAQAVFASREAPADRRARPVLEPTVGTVAFFDRVLPRSFLPVAVAA